jgi:hypothetical protein
MYQSNEAGAMRGHVKGGITPEKLEKSKIFHPNDGFLLLKIIYFKNWH